MYAYMQKHVIILPKHIYANNDMYWCLPYNLTFIRTAKSYHTVIRSLHTNPSPQDNHGNFTTRQFLGERTQLLQHDDNDLESTMDTRPQPIKHPSAD